jgi:purine-binding chemotaxis protein CheW
VSSVHVRVRVGGEEYAFPVAAVREVAELDDVVPVPGAGSAVLGVRNLRGQVLPVLDLAALLEIPRADAPTKLVVVEGASGQAGVAVDAIVGVSTLPAATEAVESSSLAGATLDDGALVATVRVDALLAEIGGRR